MTERFRPSAFLATTPSRGTPARQIVEPAPDYYGGVRPRHDAPATPKKKDFHVIKPEAQGGSADPLTPIREAIDAARSILDLEPDWDGTGSDAYDADTWNAATGFLAAQAAYALNARAKIPVPDIAPGPNGSIDLVWQEADFRLLLNVPRGGKSIGYWGQNRLVEIKGRIVEPLADHKELFLWLMKAS
jgi:hypothetical protein